MPKAVIYIFTLFIFFFCIYVWESLKFSNIWDDNFLFIYQSIKFIYNFINLSLFLFLSLSLSSLSLSLSLSHTHTHTRTHTKGDMLLNKYDACGVMVIVVGNGQILDKNDCISHSTNTLG